jgi:hypothetical protein
MASTSTTTVNVGADTNATGISIANSIQSKFTIIFLLYTAGATTAYIMCCVCCTLYYSTVGVGDKLKNHTAKKWR